jgi:GNAT superfamily N-acetyltransferase
VSPIERSAVVVRRATQDDIEGIVAVYLASARHHAALEAGRYRVPAEASVRARFTRMLEDADEEDLHLVAEADGRVVGTLDAFRRPDGAPGSMRIPARTAEVGIGVLEAWRGRGVGTLLLEAADAWAWAERLDSLLLEVAHENDGAERLYTRVGYRPVSRMMAKPVERPGD